MYELLFGNAIYIRVIWDVTSMDRGMLIQNFTTCVIFEVFLGKLLLDASADYELFTRKGNVIILFH